MCLYKDISNIYHTLFNGLILGEIIYTAFSLSSVMKILLRWCPLPHDLTVAQCYMKLQFVLPKKWTICF